MALRSPLSRVLGAGSAKEGTDHWWMQRVNSVALVVLGLWFLVSLAGVAGFDHGSLVAWVASPSNAIMLTLLCMTIAWHSMLGVQVVIEDYVHGASLKVVSLLLNKFVHVLFGVAGVLAVLKVFFGTPL